MVFLGVCGGVNFASIDATSFSIPDFSGYSSFVYSCAHSILVVSAETSVSKDLSIAFIKSMRFSTSFVIAETSTCVRMNAGLEGEGASKGWPPCRSCCATREGLTQELESIPVGLDTCGGVALQNSRLG